MHIQDDTFTTNFGLICIITDTVYETQHITKKTLAIRYFNNLSRKTIISDSSKLKSIFKSKDETAITSHCLQVQITSKAGDIASSLNQHLLLRNSIWQVYQSYKCHISWAAPWLVRACLVSAARRDVLDLAYLRIISVFANGRPPLPPLALQFESAA